MQKCYIISYDLRYNRDYTALYNAIKSYGTWGKITQSTWAIVTPQTAEQVRNFLLNYIDNDDRIIVVKSGGVAAWHNAMANNDWLKENLVKV